MSKLFLNVSLVLLTLLFLCFVVLGNEDPAARALIGGALPEDVWHAKAIYKALYDIGVGGLVSVLFYYLLVRLPENAKRNRVRRSLERQFVNFKKSCLSVILGTIHTTYAFDTIEELLDQKAFRNYFKEKATLSQDRWDVFLNQLDSVGLREILSAMELLREEVNFALSAVDIPADAAFDFLKRLSRAIHSIQHTSLGYDEVKPLSNFLWTMFSGFDFTTGYQEEDVVGKMIRSI